MTFGRRLHLLRKQATWMGLSAAAGIASAMLAGAPPALTIDGLLGFLGAQTGLHVRREDVRWAESSGYLGDLILGRRLLFLASEQPEGKRDLYRARVRLTDGGQPLTLHGLHNLTRTPLGDDVGLEVAGEHAAWATLAFGKVQAISIAELDGVRDEDQSGGAFLGLLRRFTNLQMTGTWSGVGRTDVVLHTPMQQVELLLGNDKLRVRLGSGLREFDYDLSQRTARAPDGSQAHGIRVVPNRHPAKPFVLWAVDTVREEVGPEPIAWLEEKVFGVRSLLRLATFRLTASTEEQALREGSGEPPPMLDATKLGSDDAGWPPPNVSSQWKQVEPGEGVWLAVDLPFLRPTLAAHTGDAKPPAYFYQTFTRPDPKRPYAKLWFIALDMRQLELGMQAGFEDPEPLTGPAGDGKLPDDRTTQDRIVAAFNGAFKTEHGKYGMMVQKRVLLPAVPGGATVAVDSDREVWLGSWPKSEHIPDNFVSFRQNLDPLVEDGVANPTGRQLWGWQLEGKSVMTERTALCVTPAGHLYYAWGEEIDGPMLGQALRQVGCIYGLHLDMNPGHCGFVFARVDDWQRHQYTLKHAVPKMSIPLDRYMRWSPKDFFYVTLRDPEPPPVERSSGDALRWAIDGGTQPPPTWWPGIYRATTAYAGISVELWSFERGRFDWTVRAGTREPNEVGAPLMKTALSGDEAHRVLAAIGLAYTTKATRLGMAFDGKMSIPLRPKMATLVMRPGEPLTLSADALPSLGATDIAVQLPLLAVRGEVTAEGRAQGPMRDRAAICVARGHRVIVGRTHNDTAFPLVTTLLSVGCRDVAELDRGSSDPSFMHRSGTELAPTGDYETSVLYVLGRQMIPHANRWKPEGASASHSPTGYDLPKRK
jgi:hypothetical protein